MIRRMTSALRKRAPRLPILGIAVSFLGATISSFPHASLAQGAAVPPYSARALHHLPDGTETTGIVVKSGSDMRLEYVEGSRQVVQILRRAEGVMYMLDPARKSYFEIRGEPSPDAGDAGYMPPCPEGDPSLTCTYTGTEVTSGITAERWEISRQGQPGATVILWDGARHRALRQEFPDGAVMQLTFVAMEPVNGRQTEHWALAVQAPGQDAGTGDWFYDPELRVEIREIMPSGESRTLDNIAVGPVDPALFQVPEGWTRLDMPQPGSGN